MRQALFAFLAIACFAVFLNGCCNTHFKMKQLGDDVHTYFLDGDPEDLSEAEPDSAI